MKHFNGRLLAGILVPLAIGGTLAGCGDDNDASSGTPKTTTSKPAASAAAVDRAFVRQMIPHHQMAIMMAKVAKTNGQHAEVKELAANIIAVQAKEIEELIKLASDLGSDTHMGAGHGSMSSDARTLGLTVDEMGMSMDMHGFADADPFDQAFIDEMTPHHEGAVAMAKAQLAGGENADLKKLSTAIISAQEKEIADMATWRAKWYPDAATTGGTSDSGDNDDMPHMGH